NLMGKRGDFTARTVITPGSNNDIATLRVPVSIAKTITFPEVVNRYNIDKLSELVKNRRDYPGANFVHYLNRSDKNSNSTKRTSRKDLRYCSDITLQYGDIVERHLMSGDVVLLNRQPTLHKQSMMALKIYVIDDP